MKMIQCFYARQYLNTEMFLKQIENEEKFDTVGDHFAQQYFCSSIPLKNSKKMRRVFQE